jgi:Sulfatase-modifying factor enzyme 1
MDKDLDPGFALFSLPGWRGEKLQLLRWLARDRPPVSGPVLGALRRALDDPDWELRATAMLVAGRLRAAALAGTIAHLSLPHAPAQGVSRDECGLLLALREATLRLLARGSGDRVLPPGVLAAADGDLGGLGAGHAACVHALTEPLPDDAPQPCDASGIVLSETGARLCEDRLLAWVPPVPHRLGDDALRNSLPNPARVHTPITGFYIDAEPRGLLTLAQAVAAAQEASQRLGRAVRLPKPEMWEMAARGPDGRRFPWGMNAERQARSDLSPWGMACRQSAPGEWLEAEDGIGICGSDAHALALAFLSEADPRVPRRYRFVYL